MSKLKLGDIRDDKPVKLTVELPAQVHRDLKAYAEILGAENGQTLEPTRLIAPMLERFMKTDRGFAKARKALREKKIASTLAASDSS
ncbi:DUF2274 domain-containing protein [Boseongicola sp. H5]|uniref:DUF2274 domain-containing protein n=1 Tax=Boseongicola sp. H5 TaxID=2763261 RepID=UPI001D0B3E7C|nr:DUF2274 domain-containing protein [Boseongicola sp. H5]